MTLVNYPVLIVHLFIHSLNSYFSPSHLLRLQLGTELIAIKRTRSLPSLNLHANLAIDNKHVIIFH